MTMSNDTPTIAIAIDHGFDGQKTPHFYFTTGIAPIDEPITQKNVLTIEGNSYRIGGKRIDVLEDKTSTNAFRLLTYAAIAMELEHRNIKKAKVILAVGLPIGRLAAEKEKFKRYLMETPTVKFHFSGKAYIIEIVNILVFPQCYGAIVPRLPEMKSEEIVVDIGSWTVDTLYIINRSPDESRCGSDPNGLIPCMRHIDEECIKRFNTKIGENIIKDVMMTGTADIEPEFIGVIEDEIRKYTKSIYHIVREQGINVSVTPITFVGGGASLMRRYSGIERKNIHYIEDVRANAKGYEMLLKAYLKDKGIEFAG